MPLSESSISERLEDWPVARLATVGAEGQPHLVPIVFARSNARLWSPIDGKPKREGELARVRNLRARPRVSLLLDEYTDDWQRLWWIRIDAVATVVAGADSVVGRDAASRAEAAEARGPGNPDARRSEVSPADVAAAVAALEAKYPQYAELPLLRPPATLLAFEPTRITSWSATS